MKYSLMFFWIYLDSTFAMIHHKYICLIYYSRSFIPHFYLYQKFIFHIVFAAEKSKTFEKPQKSQSYWNPNTFLCRLIELSKNCLNISSALKHGTWNSIPIKSFCIIFCHQMKTIKFRVVPIVRKIPGFVIPKKYNWFLCCVTMYVVIMRM